MFPPGKQQQQQQKTSSSSSIAATAALRQNVTSNKLVATTKTSNDDEHDAASLAETDSIGSCAATDEELLILESESGEQQRMRSRNREDGVCDACLLCNDRCDNIDCSKCTSGNCDDDDEVSPSPIPLSPCLHLSSLSNKNKNHTNTNNTKQNTIVYYTMCQVRRHNHQGSAWIVVGNKIYDATPVLYAHPGGTDCILRRAGGVKDCIDDYNFHSKKGKQMFQKYYIGTLKDCPSSPTANECTTTNRNINKDWWMFWVK